jgi:hypothetical protein
MKKMENYNQTYDGCGERKKGENRMIFICTVNAEGPVLTRSISSYDSF